MPPNRKGTITEPSKGESARKRAPDPARPDEVCEQVWQDWLALRRAKRAAVTQTVLEAARREAHKAQLSLEAFLREWCMRGSQGLKADWLLADQQRHAGRASPAGETAWQRSMRQRVAEACPDLARPAPEDAGEFFRRTKDMGHVVEVQATEVGRIAP